MALVTIDINVQKDPEEQNSYEVDARIQGVTAAYRGDREASEKISINFDGWKALDSTLRSLAARSMQEEVNVKEFGKSLFQQVMKGKVHSLYKNGKDFAHRRDSPLRLRLHLGLPELIELPWELLCEEGIYLVTTPRPRILIIRCPTNIGPIEVVKHLSPLQSMIMAAEPNRHPAGAKEEKNVLRKD